MLRKIILMVKFKQHIIYNKIQLKNNIWEYSVEHFTNNYLYAFKYGTNIVTTF